MPFNVTCGNCQKVLQVPDSAVGRKGRCPQCGSTMVVEAPPGHPPMLAQAPVIAAPPQPAIYDAEEVGAQPVAEAGPNIEVGEGRRRPCVKCGEMILETAKKCRFCGEIFDPLLRRRSGGNLATPMTRLGAVLLDGLVGLVFVLPAMIVLVVAGSSGGDPADNPMFFVGMAVMVVGILALAVYQCVLLSTKGQTIGKRLMKVRIVRYDDGGPAGFVKAVLLRAVVPQFIGAIPMVGPLFGLVDPLFIFGEERRCIHDLIAGTKVVCA